MLFAKCRPVLPAFLMLAALLGAHPAPADTPAAPAATAPAASQTITLQHILSGDLLQSLHWDKAEELPTGVTKITALPATNALSIVATPDGFAQVQEIVALADVAPRQVKMEFTLAVLTDAQLKASGIHFDPAAIPAPVHPKETPTGYASAAVTAAFLRKLQTRRVPLQSITLTTASNVDAASTLTGGTSLPQIEGLTFAATPRVGDDGTVTLLLHPQALGHAADTARPAGTTVATLEEARLMRTVSAGQSVVLTPLFADMAQPHQHLVLFVTPTVLPAK